MKQKRRGFTLIELLAVIVILAIIALIAVPVIMNIISSARKSAFEDTAYGIIKAGEMYYASALLENGMSSDKEFIITDGKFVGDSLDVKGSLPTNGKITVTKDGKVAIALDNGNYCVTKATSESQIKTDEYVGSCDYRKAANSVITTNEFAESIDACVTTGTCAAGTKFAIEVAPGEVKNFYVVSDVDSKLTLILDRNVDETTVAWITQGDYEKAGGTKWSDWSNNNTFGPITALNYLESKTSSWTNIPAKNYTLTDDNTTAIYTIERKQARARMLTKTEALSVGCQEYDTGCPDWLYGNLAQPPYGFWLSSARADYAGSAWSVDFDGGVYGDGVYRGGSYGVRPVIEILKSNI